APDLELIRRRLKNLVSENSQAMRKYLEYLNLRVSRCDKGVAESLIKRKIEGVLWRIQNNMQALSVAVNTKLENYVNKLELQKTTVESLNPLSILNRGYSILEDDNGQLITSVNQLSKGESLRAVLKDGSADLTVEDINESKGEKRPEVLV
ncbi:MAG: hypothetical protein FWH55_14755, partial [Oscillospiraceae bacterium]|nr:hypothetical protein [Oscillospiraceae bacterium]